jgi:DNA polymerase sigma
MESIWSSGDSQPESTIQILPRRDNGHNNNSSSLQPALAPAGETTPPTTSTTAATTTTTPSRPKKEAPQPKRLWTNFNDQPGRLFVNNVSGKDLGYILEFAPRAELVAKWSIPIAYIQERRNEMNPRDASLDEALNGLTIGLFRRGCTENGQQASIISKAITGYDYWHDPNSQCIQGKVPFFSPRTPGNVLFRMYWENNPLHTLAMGPTLRVRVTEHDFESSVRFILGNFRGKKSNPTSLSSLHSLATVLETTLSNRHESAARAVWGCLQESRKVIDICYDEYIKTSAKLSTLEIQVEALKEKVADEENKSHESGDDRSGDRESRKRSDAELSLYEKIRTLMSGRASCERKWRDSQLAFANILKAILSNASIHPLIRREQMVKLRLETELWCPLSEEFAIPSDTAGMWLECIYELPPVVTENHFKVYREAREKMQLRTLGSSLNMITLEDVVFPLSPETNQRAMNPKAIALFNQLSSSMGQYYQDLFKNEERVVRRRELIRARCQAIVRQAGLFPPETEVVIFGSSANGFGSPMSDMDMCLQLPHGAIIKDDDGKASEAMAKLVKHLEEGGMLDVDSSRLSARIPIIKFNSPNPLPDGTDDVIECDLSMQNPLAVLNTSLLRTYAEINPVTRVLAAVIKRWAKARDINCPERHTLSSYGYVIMLLHFLTFHHRTPSGLVAPIAPVEGSPRTQNGFHAPILPNLQWVDPPWVGMPKGTPYRELASIPEIIMKHPMKDKTTVNTYFYKPSSPPDKAALQLLFPGQDLSLSILLASFFRYYAYEFDFKRHVVSLHSTATNGIVEREVKAELDGWRNYSAALAIEDPFELEYDVAHVLRGGFYHRIRREFALAYSKIVEADSPDNLIDLLCEPVVADPDKDAAELQQGR